MKVRGRFAPSPTGRMHLGNVCAALLSWHSSKSRGGDWILRIEDLDPQRSRKEYADQLIADLYRLGLEPDEGGLNTSGNYGPYTQSERNDFYQRALEQLQASGRVYPCGCTRADILATQAPHQSDGRIVYSGKCRPAPVPPFENLAETGSGLRQALRIWVPDEDIEFNDRICGPQSVNLARHCGDFIIRRADGAWAYQLAVVVDDALMGITEVVRGDDLLLSSAQQIYLYRLLGHTPPEFAHFPLIRNTEGQRLSKRDRSQSLEHLFKEKSPEEIIGLAAHLTGLRPSAEPISPLALL